MRVKEVSQMRPSEVFFFSCATFSGCSGGAQQQMQPIQLKELTGLLSYTALAFTP